METEVNFSSLWTKNVKCMPELPFLYYQEMNRAGFQITHEKSKVAGGNLKRR